MVKKQLFLLIVILFSNRVYTQQLIRDKNYNRIQFLNNNNWHITKEKGNIFYFQNGLDSTIKFSSNLLTKFSDSITSKGFVLLPPETINYFIYSSKVAMYESNIGNGLPESSYPIIYNNDQFRILLNYNGSYTTLSKELINNFLESCWMNTFKENEIKLDYQDIWLREGYIQLITNKFLNFEEVYIPSVKYDNWQEYINNNDFKVNLRSLYFCKYINKKYGKYTLDNIIILVKQGKSLNTAFKIITKEPLGQCQEDFIKTFSTLEPKKLLPNNVNKIQPPWFKESLLYKDYSNYLVDSSFSINYKKGSLYIQKNNNKNIKTKLPTKIDGVNEIILIEKNKFIINAFRLGQSDILEFNKNNNKIIPISNNLVDEKNLQIVNNNILYEKDSIYYNVANYVNKLNLLKTKYKLQFTKTWFNANINNDFLTNKLQPFKSNLGGYQIPEIGAMFNSGVSDIFENHTLNIAYRLPTNNRGNEFFAKYEYNKNKIDWSILFYRKVERLNPQSFEKWNDSLATPFPQQAKNITKFYELSLKIPFDYYNDIVISTALSHNETIFLSLDKYSLYFPSIVEKWNISTFKYNLKKINKIKNTSFSYNGFTNQFIINSLISLENKTKNELIIAFKNDFYLEKKINNIVSYSLNLKNGISLGSKYVNYIFGGVNNDLFLDNNIENFENYNAPIAFQEQITQFRGVKLNSYNGNRFSLLNLDVYFQVFGGLVKSNTKYKFLNDFQIGIFSDNLLLNNSWNKLTNQNMTIYYSYGLSFRTTLAKYPLRVDISFPNNISKSLTYNFSIRI